MAVYVLRNGGRRGDLTRVEQWARTLLLAIKQPDSELSIVISDDAFIRPLNLEWRAKDSATDVLSFPQGEGPGPVILGDVVISVETALRQAEQVGHSLDQELQVLLVHGLCHLLGHDHQDLASSTAMAALEASLLTQLCGREVVGLIHRVDPRDAELP